MKNMKNRNIIQRVTQTTSLGIIICRCSLDSQHGGSDQHPANAGFLFPGTQKTAKAISLIRDVSAENGLGKTTNLHFKAILEATRRKVGLEKE